MSFIGPGKGMSRYGSSFYCLIRKKEGRCYRQYRSFRSLVRLFPSPIQATWKASFENSGHIMAKLSTEYCITKARMERLSCCMYLRKNGQNPAKGDNRCSREKDRSSNERTREVTDGKKEDSRAALYGTTTERPRCGKILLRGS